MMLYNVIEQEAALNLLYGYPLQVTSSVVTYSRPI